MPLGKLIDADAMEPTPMDPGEPKKAKGYGNGNGLSAACWLEEDLADLWFSSTAFPNQNHERVLIKSILHRGLQDELFEICVTKS